MSWEYELDGEVYRLDDFDDLRAARDGDYGSEYQQIAEQIVEDEEAQANGGAKSNGDLSPEDDWLDAMESQFHRLQNRLERPLTSAEFKAIADDTARGEVPDLVKEYGEQLEARQRAPAGSEDRHQLMVEEYEDTKAQHEEAEQPSEEC